jgi:hypothetical protein
VTSLGVPTTSLGGPATSLGAPQNTVEQSGKMILFGIDAGALRNHSYYLSFNDFENSCIQFVLSSMYLCIYVSMYQYSYPSTNGIFELAADSA